MKIDFEVCHTAMIPQEYLLPNILEVLSINRGYSDNDKGIDEFICPADIFEIILESNEDGLIDHFTAEEKAQWKELADNFAHEDIHYIHITKI